jgi:hypothetical protein
MQICSFWSMQSNHVSAIANLQLSASHARAMLCSAVSAIHPALPCAAVGVVSNAEQYMMTTAK